MSGKKTPGKSVVPEISSAQLRYREWVSRAYGFAGLCLAALAIAEVTGNASPLVRTLTMLGIALAGTVAWAMQAKRECPECGAQYGYAIRIVHSNYCRKCGAEYPKWLPGMDEGGSAGKQ
jgi:predicted RNA-binding Zn-ribbon protein involved in translation (DUF1610 family)